MKTGADVFQEHRPSLVALAYRMLGDLARANDLVQEAWLRWERREATVESPKAYLLQIITRLCLNEMDSARARREDLRGDRLPEPVSLRDAGIERVEAMDRISMAFLVLLQRLSPAERAVLLLHEVFDFDHTEIASLIGKSQIACRQLLRRARQSVAAERREMLVSPDEHRDLLRAFLQAAATGDLSTLERLLTEDVVLVADAGPNGGRYGRVRNLPGPLRGVTKVAAFVASVAPQGAQGLSTREVELNGQPAILIERDGRPYTAILLSTTAGRINGIYIHADASRLRHVGTTVAR